MVANSGSEECKANGYEPKLETKTSETLLNSNNIFEMSYWFDFRV